MISAFNFVFLSLKRILLWSAPILCIISCSIIQYGCSSENKRIHPGWIKEEGAVWNTTYHITYKSEIDLRDSIITVLNRVGNSLSIFDKSSLVNIVNNQDSTPVNSDFRKVYITSYKIFNITEGAFDPTLSPLITAWGFGPGHTPTADTLRIDSIRKFVGIDKTRFAKGVLYKQDPRIQFNFSAIAKGYGCDAVGEMLVRNGVSDFLVEIGGEIKAGGKNPENGKWRISIDRPILSGNKAIHESQEIVEVSNMGVATSGNYRNFHTEGTRRFGHTISSKTGRPVQTDVISATVLSSSAMAADGLATAFMALDSERVKEINNSLRLPVMLVLQDSTVWTSKEFDQLIAK